MLDVVRSAARQSAIRTGFDVEILSLATANPPFQLTQAEAAARAKELFPHLKRLWPLYDNTGIDRRYNCEPIEWYLKPHSWEERTASFHRHALDLLEQVTVKTTEAAGIRLGAIDMIVTNTVTGLAVPSLDAMLLNRLRLAPTIERLPMFGLGCGAGVAGLSRAARLAHASDGAYVLFLTVDLCSLCLRVGDPSAAMFVSTALFATARPEYCCTIPETARALVRAFSPTANGAGAAPETSWDGTSRTTASASCSAPTYPRCWSGSWRRHCMIFSIGTDFVSRTSTVFCFIRVAASSWNGRQTLGLTRQQLAHSWDVLRRYGNMSSRPCCSCLSRRSRRARAARICSPLSARAFPLFRCSRPMIDFDWGALLLAYLTVQRWSS